MKAFIFDMDGVLVDTQKLHSQATLAALQEFGVASSMAEVGSYAGTKRGTAFQGIAEKRGIALPIEKLCERKEKLFSESVEQADLKPIDGIVELLQGLQRAQVATAIASSSSDEFIRYIVDRLQIRTYFSRFLSGQNLPESKPNPAIYRLAAEALSAAPETCVVLEDAALGVKAAKAAGMYCIGYRNLNSGNQDLSQADRIVNSIREICIDEL